MTSSSPRELAAILTGSPLVIMLDIDGTLCDIVQDPDDAYVPAHASDSIRELNRMCDRDVHVALITGRGVADARRMIGFDGVVIYGNHGSERVSRSGTVYQPERWTELESRLRAAAEQIGRVARDYPGVRLEDKRLSLTLHYRDMDMNRAAELHKRVLDATRDAGLVIVDGKCVINIVPEGAQDKGDAVLEVIDDVGAGRDISGASILFAGDDVTDEDAFEALQNDSRAVTVRVGNSARPTAAKFSVESPRDVHALLEVLQEQRS